MRNTFSERCRLAEACLPPAGYRNQLRLLHAEMLDRIAELEQKLGELPCTIELPAFQLMDDPDGEGRGEYVMREVLEAKIEKQGFKCRVKGE